MDTDKMKVLQNINEELDQAEINIAYCKDKIQTLQAVNKICTTPEVIELNKKAIIYVMECIDRIRLAQFKMLKEQELKEIIQSN